MKLLWRIYYPDSTFSNLDGNPEDAPPVGVICIKHNTENKWEICAFGDYYIFDKQWWKADSAGFWQYMFKPGLKTVKFGTSLIDFKFERIMAQAREDTEGGMEKL